MRITWISGSTIDVLICTRGRFLLKNNPPHGRKKCYPPLFCQQLHTVAWDVTSDLR